ncbi:uncharacterized protein MELLADRAFT_104964 [Melampsora larici-populina 98AG31]|uniref:Uncharacterized protein n=1 Tax=Melampsora larici-populina (strain 98AG31 / pathotype 3-4-7) TaxID=747676 RepID=F4RG23_MELLP|nr:uncharacterized protein MELLADRAFT_104964 [Melampsora larici-populina 98AG31]EGG08618.1 hypothetical protein MELLADRAFT_104964 [Melampsora larici-populina 98AG31]
MSNPSVPVTVTRTISICDFMNKLGSFTPKEFMVTFLSSNHPDLVYRRRQMKAGMGSKQTRSIVKNLGKLAVSCEKGKAEWEELILDEASAIVNAQELPRGQYPHGAYVSSNEITPDFFSESADLHRTNQVVSGMKFLHALIHRKISAGISNRMGVENDEPAGLLQAEVPPTMNPPLRCEDVVDEATLLAMDSLVYVKSTPADYAAHKLAKVPTMVCQMVAVTCNRRANGISLANGLMALAGGVSCRVHEWLHSLGLTTSRANVLGLAAFLKAMDAADRQPVNMMLFSPQPEATRHWALVIKAQLAKALCDYTAHLPGGLDPHDLPTVPINWWRA